MNSFLKYWLYSLLLIYAIFFSVGNCFGEDVERKLPEEENIPAELTILMRESNQPYVFADGTGIIADIFRESLGNRFKLNFVFLPYERGLLMLGQKQLDVISIAPETAEGIDSYYISQPYIEFQNAAFTLESGPVKDVKLENLSKLDIIAFINARIFLGNDFAQQVAGNEKYKEIQDQKAQVRALLKGRTEVAIMEKNIFAFYRNLLIKEGEIELSLKGKGFEIFPASRYCAIFRNESVKEVFNRGVLSLKESGRYNEIIASYTKDINNPE